MILRVVTAACLAIASIGCAASGRAAEIRWLKSSSCNIRIDGDIRNGDAKALENVLELGNAFNSAPPRICLNSAGGSFPEALRFIDLFKQQFAVETVVERGDACRAACAFVFMGGQADINHGFRIPWRRLHVGGVLEFRMPQVEATSGPQRGAAVQAAYSEGVHLVSELLVRTKFSEGFAPPDTSYMFARSLMLELLGHDPESPLSIETVDQAGRWSIGLFGFAPPSDVTDAMLLQSCINLGRWQGTLRGSPQALHVAASRMLSKDILLATFDGLALGKSVECKSGRFRKPKGGSLIDVTFGEAPPNAKAQQEFETDQSNSVLLTPISAVFPPETPIRALPGR